MKEEQRRCRDGAEAHSPWWRILAPDGRGWRRIEEKAEPVEMRERIAIGRKAWLEGVSFLHRFIMRLTAQGGAEAHSP